MATITNPRLSAKKLEELKHILKQDYKVVLSDEEAEAFGFSLLKITRLAIGAFNRAEEKRLMVST